MSLTRGDSKAICFWCVEALAKYITKEGWYEKAFRVRQELIQKKSHSHAGKRSSGEHYYKYEYSY